MVEPRKMRHLIQSSCGCTCDCFEPFRAEPHFGTWLILRKMLLGMTKLEKDQQARSSTGSLSYHQIMQGCIQPNRLQVFKMLQSHGEACRGSRHLNYLGFPLCNSGFMKMMSIGKSRFQSLNQAARSGSECPWDQRYVPKGPQVPSENRMKVHEFLTSLWMESAEHIPDKLNSNKRPRQADHKLDSKGMDRSLIKHLPHGSINDYYVQCVASLGIKISKKMFSSASS